MKNILILCSGNICRSPMAEGLFRSVFNDNKAIHISSAGITALVGQPPAIFAQEIMQEKKHIDISHYRAKQVTSSMLLEADIILVMDLEQKKQIEFHLEALYGRVLRLGQWSNFDIADPYRRPKKAFEQTLVLIEQCLRDWQIHL